MTKIDRTLQNKIQADLVKAFAEVAAKYGLEQPSVDLRRDRAGTFVRLMKLDMNVKTNDIPVINLKTDSKVGGTPLERALARIGVTKMTNSKGERIVDYKPSRPKYPFVFEGPKGGRWKATEANIKARFAA
jgi:hypothetical protein